MGLQYNLESYEMVHHSVSSYMVNQHFIWKQKEKSVQIFEHFKCSKISIFFSFCSQKNVGYQGWSSRNACQNSKQEDPDQIASSEAVCLIWVCTVCIDFFGRQCSVQNFKTSTIYFISVVNFLF